MDIICKHQTSQSLSPNFFKVHTHTHYEIYFIMRGSGLFVVEGHEYPLSQNCMLLLRPGEMHRAEIASGSVYERCYLHFSEDAVDGIDLDGRLLLPFKDRQIGQNNFYEAVNIDASFIKKGLLRIENALSQSSDDKEPLRHYLYVILKEILDAFGQAGRGASYSPSYDKEIYKIIEYINNNLEKDLSLAEIERMFFISRPILSKRFKAATGTTVWDYIITKRIMLADRLITGGESATEAAYAVGYGDYSAFYRAYREIIGHSPTR